MKTKSMLLIPACLILLSACAGKPTGSDGQTASNNSGKICRYEKTTGSNIGTKICRTPAQAEAERKAAKKAMKTLQTNRPINGG